MGGFPGPRMTPVPPPPPPPRAPTGQTPPITVCSYSSTNSSPSPILPFRDHRRPRARSLSAHRTYEERNEAIRERERREYERRRNEELRVRAQRRLEEQRRLQIEDADRQRRRRSQEEREGERLAAAIVDRRRRQELARRRAAQADALAEEQWRAAARRRRDEEQRRERIQEERDRLARQRRVHIPRGARHATVIHHHYHHHDRETNGFQRRAREDFEDDGDRVLNDAIRAEHFRPAGHAAPQGGQPRWPHAQGLRRRGAIAAGERRVYDDDLRRRGPRWF